MVREDLETRLQIDMPKVRDRMGDSDAPVMMQYYRSFITPLRSLNNSRNMDSEIFNFVGITTIHLCYI